MVKFTVHYWPRGKSHTVDAGTKEMPNSPWIVQTLTHEIDGVTRRVKVIKITPGKGGGHYPGDELTNVYVVDE
jgi:hypothetical protein